MRILRAVTQSFDNVKIIFLSAGEKPFEYAASVVLRGAEMVIDIPSHSDGGPYLVRGRLAEHFFAGTNEVRDVDSVAVVARWTKLGDVWVGIWFEEGFEYLFSFRLPKS
jgi:hypothetical protein